jgi:WXG100 family type VII secretion target
MKIFQANSEQLEQCAQMFRQESDRMTQTLNELKNLAEGIRGVEWIGLGANTFFDVFDTTIEPSFKRIIEFMDAGDQHLTALAKQVDDSFQMILSRARTPNV